MSPHWLQTRPSGIVSPGGQGRKKAMQFSFVCRYEAMANKCEARIERKKNARKKDEREYSYRPIVCHVNKRCFALVPRGDTSNRASCSQSAAFSRNISGYRDPTIRSSAIRTPQPPSEITPNSTTLGQILSAPCSASPATGQHSPWQSGCPRAHLRHPSSIPRSPLPRRVRRFRCHGWPLRG